METKQCSKCGEVKPLVEYGTLRGISHNMPWCKVCNRKKYKKFRKNNYKQEKQRSLKKYYNNIDSYKQYRKTKSDEIKQYMSEYRIKNNQNIKESQKEWLSKNPNYYKNRYWSEPEFRFMCIVQGHLQGVKNRKEFKDLWDDVREVYDFYGIDYHIDHKVPKSWFKVNSPKYLINNLDNLQVIDAHSNLSKNNNWSDPVEEEYLNQIRPYIKKKYEGLLKSL